MATAVRADSRRLDFPLMFDRIAKWSKQHGTNVPTEVKFRFTKHGGTSGRCYGNGPFVWRMHFSFGYDYRDAEYVILHELAHTMEGSEDHNDNFYVNLFTLLIKYGNHDITAYAVRSEVRYKKRMATKVASHMGLLL